MQAKNGCGTRDHLNLLFNAPNLGSQPPFSNNHPMEAPLVALPPNILPVILYRAAWAEILHGLSVVEFLAVVQ
jgi:hypothetical protein